MLTAVLIRITFFLYVISLVGFFTLLSRAEHAVIKAWGNSPNSPIRTTEESPTAEVLSAHISEVVGNAKALAVRIAASTEEAEAAAKRFSENMYLDVSEKTTISMTTPEADYVLWGSPESGGRVSGDVYEVLGQQAHNGTKIRANDLCALHDAFVALYNGKVACWGNNDTCTGWRDASGTASGIEVTMAYCPQGGVASIIMLTAPHPSYGGRISIFGHPSRGGTFPTDTQPRLMKTLSKIGADGPVQVVGNEHALCVLFQGGQVFAWGEEEFGGSTPSMIELTFAKSIIANSIGFSLLTTTQKIYTWGGSQQEIVPKRIRDGGDGLVRSMYASGECFGALLENGSVATWGRGDQMYCAEQGAGQSDQYVSYLTIKDKVQKDIIKLVMNEKSFAAVTKDHEIITWGRIDSGGSTKNDSEVRWIRPEALVASCCAYAFIREDGRIVSWGNQDTGGLIDPILAVYGATRIVATRFNMAALSPMGWLIVWGGEESGFYSIDSAIEAFRLAGPVAGLLRAPEGLVAIMGDECKMSEWTPWSACTRDCGGGSKQRSRTMVSPPLNTVCNASRTETASCNTQSCTAPPQTNISYAPPVGLIVAVGAGSLLVLGLGFYTCIACARGRAAAQRDTL